MSQIPCKQSTRIEMTSWFKHYFPSNLKRNFLVTVCNYTSYQNLQKTSLPNPFAREKTGDKAGTAWDCEKGLSGTVKKDKAGTVKKRGTRQAWIG